MGTVTAAITVSCPALMGTQNGVRIFTGMMEAKDLISVTTVDHFNSSVPIDSPKQGYQRPPERSRITKIGSHLLKAIVHGEGESGGLFPTAVVLAARSPLKYHTGRLTIADPLQVIDGQHRIAGLRYAIEEKGTVELGDYPIAFVIIEVSERLVEMNQFTIINGTAKSVRTDLVNSILTATAAKRGDSAIAEKDRWKVVVTRVVERLDKDPASPWHSLILMPDEAGSPKSVGGKIVRATSFMTSLAPVHAWLKEFGFLDRCPDLNSEAGVVYDVVAAYWQALKQVAPDPFAAPDDYVIQKTPGLFSLHKLLAHLLPVMFKGHQAWTKENFVKFLQDSPEIGDAQFWQKDADRAAAYGSMKGFQDLYELLRDSVEPRP
ncbi:MAG TPA: DGQHR domain-containing protein [Candidatus Acidoferrum sp.]|nr:DGQHR domain-containing protein [Candidatus Acidoferrum sp.]